MRLNSKFKGKLITAGDISDKQNSSAAIPRPGFENQVMIDAMPSRTTDFNGNVLIVNKIKELPSIKEDSVFVAAVRNGKTVKPEEPIKAYKKSQF